MPELVDDITGEEEEEEYRRTLEEEDDERERVGEAKRFERVEDEREPEPDPEKEEKMEEPEPEPGEMIEVISMNIGTAETHDDIAFGFEGVALVCVQESRLDRQGQRGLEIKAKARRMSLQLGQPLPRQTYIVAGQKCEQTRPGGVLCLAPLPTVIKTKQHYKNREEEILFEFVCVLLVLI